MMSNYIYLLQEREFIKTNENIYKVGMTEKENHIRFNQYPKGSVLLFQIICRNCRNMENKILTQFKTEFKLRKDIGNEYFEGDYKNMIDVIYSIVKKEDKLLEIVELKINSENISCEDDDSSCEEEQIINIEELEKLKDTLKMEELEILKNTLKEKRKIREENELKYEDNELEEDKKINLKIKQMEIEIEQLKSQKIYNGDDNFSMCNKRDKLVKEKIVEKELVESELKCRNVCKQSRDLHKTYYLNCLKEETEEIIKLEADIKRYCCRGNIDEVIKDLRAMEEKLKKRIEEENLIEKENEIDKELELVTSYQVTTYEEWISVSSDIDKIIITNKKGEGYFRFKGGLWRILYNKNMPDFDADSMETLRDFINFNQSPNMKIVLPKNHLDISQYPRINLVYTYSDNITDKILNRTDYLKLDNEEQQKYSLIINNKYSYVKVENDSDKIFKDTIKKCYLKEPEFYDLKYCEYVLSKKVSEPLYFIFNALNLTFTSIDKVINNKILTTKFHGERHLYLNNEVNTCVVDDILNSLIDTKTKLQYKILMRNLIVGQEEKQIIFYDYGKCLLTDWATDILYTISGKRLYTTPDNFDDKTELKRNCKINNYRCIIIYPDLFPPIETQIKDAIKLGFKNIIVAERSRRTNKMYDIIKFEKYLQDNKEMLINLINYETNQGNKDWTYQYANDIFYDSRLLLTNFLKWCCV